MAETHQPETVNPHQTFQPTIEHGVEPTGLAAGAKALGLDGKLLIAQIINFVILVLILRRFVYRPIVGLLESRRTRIAESLSQAEAIDERMKAWEAEYAKRLNEAKSQAAQIIEEAKQAGEESRQKTLAAAQAESKRLLERVQTQLAAEKERLLAEVKQEVGQLVVAATAKIIDKKLDLTTDRSLIEQAVKEVSR